MLRIYFSILLVGVLGCQAPETETAPKTPKVPIATQVATTSAQLNKSLTEAYVVILNHHAMAKEEGVYTPPAIVTIFSNPEVNTPLMQLTPLVGLDLPWKVLCYAEQDTGQVYVAYTDAEFIAKRHQINAEALQAYQARMDEVLGSLESVTLSPTNLESVNKGYGIYEIQSDFDYATTVGNLRAIVAAQSDTRWFGEVDFQKDAVAQGVDIQPANLLLFGGPAPGAKAMKTTPKIGLDAFCQKLLVYQKSNGEVWIAFNNIVAFSELYYAKATKPQQLINQRLKATFNKAVKQQK
jgi:uncharacterized protein (DUF302 family)